MQLFVSGLEFYGYHGVPDAEQAVGHRYRVDLVLGLGPAAGETDEVADTVDYGAVSVWLVGRLTAERFRTLERAARVAAEELLTRFPGCEWVELTLGKRLPPAPIIAEEAGVVVRVERDRVS